VAPGPLVLEKKKKSATRNRGVVAVLLNLEKSRPGPLAISDLCKQHRGSLALCSLHALQLGGPISSVSWELGLSCGFPMVAGRSELSIGLWLVGLRLSKDNPASFECGKEDASCKLLQAPPRFFDDASPWYKADCVMAFLRLRFYDHRLGVS
jgi:hypothetical protein